MWSVALCGALVFYFHYRPMWSARHFVRTASEDAFRAKYRGRRWVGGEIIAPRGETGGLIDPTASLVRSENLDILAEEVSWKGDRAELVVRHRIVIENGNAKETTAFVQLERNAGHWQYAHFEVRGKPPHDTPILGNPFDDAL